MLRLVSRISYRSNTLLTLQHDFVNCRNLSVSHARFVPEVPTPSSHLPSDYGIYDVSLTVPESLLKWVAESSWIQGFENSLVYVHDLTHLPWYGSIILCTVVLRFCVMTPLLMVQLSMGSRRGLVSHNLQKIETELTKEMTKLAKNNKNWDAYHAGKFYKAAISKQDDQLCRIFKAPGKYRTIFLPLIQAPIWVSMMVSLRHLSFDYLFFNTTDAQMTIYNSLSAEGVLWFQNLCVPDPYFILPIIMCTANLFVLNLYGKQRMHPALLSSLRFLNICIVLPVMCILPTAPVLYATTSSIYAMIQALFLQHRFRKV